MVALFIGNSFCINDFGYCRNTENIDVDDISGERTVKAVAPRQ
jgi:hypothetical protein